MGSSSSSSNKTSTTNIDDRVAVDGGGIVLQTEGSHSTIIFEDLTAETLELGFGLAGEAIELVLDKATGLFSTALSSNNNALANTQSFSESLIRENNTPSSDNIKNIAIAGLLVAGASVTAIIIWRK